MMNSGAPFALNLAGMHGNSQASGPVDASDVVYDPDTSSLVSTDVQSALDEVSGKLDAIVLPGLMTPTVSGKCYGKQDQATTVRTMGLGLNVKPGNKSTTLYNPNTASLAQKLVTSDSFVALNNVDEIAQTAVPFRYSSMIANGGSMTNMSGTFNSLLLSYCDINDASIDNTVMLAQSFNSPPTETSVVCVSYAPARIAGIIQNSVIIGRQCENEKTGNITDSILITAYLDMLSAASPKNACIVLATGGNALTTGTGSCFIGGTPAPYTQSNQELTFYDFRKVVIKTLPVAVKPNLTYYDASTGELTYHDLSTNNMTIGRTTQVMARDAVSQKLFAVPAGNTTITKVLRGSAVTDAGGYYVINISSFGIVSTSDYSVSCTVTNGSAGGTIFSITAAKTTVSITILIEKFTTGGAAVLVAPGCPFDFLVSY